MREIPLTQGQSVLVDDEDFPYLAEFKWCYRSERGGRQGYAVRHTKVDGKDRLCYMHRQLMPTGPRQEVIFLNYDRLDCRRENLRVVSKEEARQHHRVRSDSKSGSKGVRYNPQTETWYAYVCRDGRYYSFGSYATKKEAEANYEAYLKRENPELHTSPEKVERVMPRPVARSKKRKRTKEPLIPVNTNRNTMPAKKTKENKRRSPSGKAS